MRLVSRRFALVSVAAVAGAVLLAVVLAALLLPGIVRRTLAERLEARVTAPVRIGRVRVNLFTGRARASDIVVGGADGGPPILRVAALDAGLSYRGLLGGTSHLYYLTFNEPDLFVERTGPESINIIQTLRPTTGQGAMIDFIIDQVNIRGGRLRFVDRTQTPAFERTFTDVRITTDRLSNLPRLRFTPTSFELWLGIGRGALVVTGATAPFGRPAGVEVVARMERLEPGLLTGYLPLRASIDLSGSQVNGEVRYTLAYEGDRVIENGLTARVETGPIRFVPPEGGRPIVTAAGLSGRDITADFLAGQVRLGDVVVSQPHVILERGADGTWSVARLLEREPPRVGMAGPAPPPGETRQTAPPARSGRETAVTIGRARIEGGTVALADATVAPAVATTIRDIGLELREVSFQPAPRPGHLEGDLRLENGRLRVAGSVESGTLATTVRLTATGVSLDPVRGYVDAGLRRVSARGGALDARLDVAMTPGRDASAATLELRGTVEGRQLAVAFPDAAEPFLRVDRLAVELASLRILPAFSADLARVRLTGPVLQAGRAGDGVLSLARLWASPEASPAGATPASTVASPRLRLRRAEVTGGRIEFTDTAVAPRFRTMLRGLEADLQPVAGDAGRTAIRLRGLLGDGAPVEVDGTGTLLASPLRLDLRGVVRDLELARLNPYAIGYLGHRIVRGRLTSEATYRYDAGSFRADATVVIRHVEVSEPVNARFQETVGIRLPLALSLLEDSAGDIRLHVPITGDSEGRKIDFGPLIWSAVRGAIVKVAAAPFRTVGSILTLGGKVGEIRIEPIEFRRGTLEPNGETAARIVGIVEFLQARPRVSLEVAGRATPAETQALKRARLQERLKTAPPTAGTPLAAVYQEAGGRTRSMPPAEEMEAFVLRRMEITDRDLRALANRRARVIQEALVRSGIEPGRLFVARASADDITGTGPGRVEFQLLD
jgi:hypothetical protein